MIDRSNWGTIEILNELNDLNDLNELNEFKTATAE